jgi:hypothetical protein
LSRRTAADRRYGCGGTLQRAGLIRYKRGKVTIIARRLCVLKIRFCNTGDEGRRERVVM